MEQITSIVEQITHWGLTGIWKILFAIIIWFVGKKVIALCMKFLKKVFDKGSLDPGVVNFTMSIIRFALYSVLILMVIDELGIQTTSLVTVFGSAALAKGPRYLEMTDGYVTGIALDADDEIIGYKFINFGKMMDFIKAGDDANTAFEKASGQYGRVADAVKIVDPRKE